jgi:hypothetical protein
VTQDERWFRGDVDEDGNSTGQPAPPAGPVIASIPGVGDLFVAGCELLPSKYQGGNVVLGLRNTSGGPLYGLSGDTPMVYGQDNITYQNVLPAGAEAAVGYNEQQSYLIASGDGASPKITHLEVQLFRKLGGIDNCRFYVWWN